MHTFFGLHPVEPRRRYSDLKTMPFHYLYWVITDGVLGIKKIGTRE